MSQVSPKIRAFWVLILGVVLVAIFFNRIGVNSQFAQAKPEDHHVTVERIPSSEARGMGIDSRNH